MSNSFKYKNNNYLDSSGIVKNREILNQYLNRKIEYFNDTTATNINELLRNKMDLCSQQCQNETKCQMFINGGWSGKNYGFGMYSKIDGCQQLIWICTDGIYFCRKIGNIYDSYKKVSFTNI